MNHIDLEFIKSLDPHKMDGTVQAMVMTIEHQGVDSVSFENILKILIKQLKSEKDNLIRDNIALSLNEGRLE